jgi:hypothetical protein
VLHALRGLAYGAGGKAAIRAERSLTAQASQATTALTGGLAPKGTIFTVFLKKAAPKTFVIVGVRALAVTRHVIA